MELRQERGAGAGQRPDRADEGDEGRQSDQNRPIEREGQRPGEQRLQRARDAAASSFGHGARLREEQRAQRRRHQDGHRQRRQQGDDIGRRQRAKQAPFDPRQPEHGQEHQHDDQRGEDDRPANLERRVAHHDGRGHTFVHRAGLVLAQAAHHVLDVDDGVVHQGTDGDRHATQAHRVDAGPEGAQREHRRGERQRQGRQRDGGRAQVGEEQHHDDHHEHRAVAQRGQHVLHRHLDEVGLAEDPPVDGVAGRQLLLEGVQRPVQASGHLQRIGAGLFLHADDHRRATAA